MILTHNQQRQTDWRHRCCQASHFMTAIFISLFCEEKWTHSKTNKTNGAQQTNVVRFIANQVKLGHKVNQSARIRIVELVANCIRLASLISITCKLISIFFLANNFWVKHIKGYQVKYLTTQTKNNDWTDHSQDLCSRDLMCFCQCSVCNRSWVYATNFWHNFVYYTWN